MCSDHWLHAYTHPLLAVLMNPVHAGFANPVLWEAEGEIGIDDGLKVGCTKVTTLRIIDLPSITTEQRVRFGIYCAQEVCDLPAWREWADRWLSGEDRTELAAAAAAMAELAAKSAKEVKAATRAAWAAWASTAASASAAEAAIASASAASAANAARARAWGARMAEGAAVGASAAAWTRAAAAANSVKSIDFAAIAERAVAESRIAEAQSRVGVDQ
jgi:cobalamin biosynthesis Mg chelatase CobN